MIGSDIVANSFFIGIVPILFSIVFLLQNKKPLCVF